MSTQYLLRKSTPEDHPFIYNSFLQSYKGDIKEEHLNKEKHQWSLRHCPANIYYSGQSEIIKFLLENANCLVACYPEEPSELIGYILYQHIADTLVIHWLYIRKQRRNSNIAKEIILSVHPILTKNEPVIFTHHSHHIFTLKKKINLIFDPYLINNLRIQKC